ncbi:bifunctional peptidase and (3S)-lysyl hydroxylase Jmjd7 [Galendromus occidentalis]|uniref:Bifunctional peptidase and (3S)-lysyl hydroxylase Jmjd7 n=1 Tax=Galendromus occidentalis TaxID=34638 RepID=A0AAJ7PB49_9ACAR|nr:bifunctional peptidase and (3S)-lysyl hydroxylase Jmjd7 [Galendromus occidentalis]
MMKMGEFIDKIEKPSKDEVLYIQKQNSNLESEFSELEDDISPKLQKWGQQIFGTPPDACNFWMGDARAITSTHKDHYENLYCVIRGYKTFTLCAPYSCMRIPHRSCKNFAHNRNEDGTWTLEPMEGETIWASGSPLEWSTVKSIKVIVKQGDVLYLPSLWFHQVEQSHQCIAVNYWFDMRFDLKYCYFKMAESLNPSLRSLLKGYQAEEEEESSTHS